jgi:hypothetical protein
MKFIRRANKTEYIENQTVTIGSGGGSDTVENLPKAADTALEVQLDDGSIVVILGYLRK